MVVFKEEKLKDVEEWKEVKNEFEEEYRREIESYKKEERKVLYNGICFKYFL